MTVWINRRTGVMHRNRSCLALEHVLPRLLRPERFDPNRPRRRCSRTRCSASRRLRTLVAAVALRRGFVCGTSTCAMRRSGCTKRVARSRSNRCRLSTYRFCDGRSTAARSAPESMPTSSRWRGSRPDEVSAMTGVRCQLPRGAPWRARGASGAHGPLEDRDHADLSSPAEPRPSNGACPRPFLGRSPVRGLPRKGDERIRTAVRGFAGLCLTTRPRRPGRAW